MERITYKTKMSQLLVFCYLHFSTHAQKSRIPIPIDIVSNRRNPRGFYPILTDRKPVGSVDDH